MTLVVNLFAGPGAGKSTTATGVFSLLKMHGVNCEYVSEYAKDLAWEKTLMVYYNQVAILGEQHRRQHRLLGQCDVMITDSPILQQCAYVDDPWYIDACKHLFEEFGNNLNYLVLRKKKFNPKGRKHNLKQAKQIDDKIKDILDEHANGDYSVIDGDYAAVNHIVDVVLKKLRKRQRYFIEDGC
jgi:hypothetical protein